MRPIALRLPIKFRIANNMTTIPAVLKKTPDHELFWMLKDEKLTSASTGNVPSAKVSIVSPPLRKDPVESV